MPTDLREYVDTNRFPKEAFFQGFDVAKQVRRFLLPSIEQGPAEDLLRSHNSFGGVVSRPQRSLDALRCLIRKDPYNLVWFGFGWGVEQARYMANAFRKLVPTVEELRDSLELVFDDDYTFRNPVESAEPDGRFLMGAYPFGGAKIVSIGNIWIAGAVSALDMREDDVAAGMASLYTGCQLYKLGGRNPLKYLARPKG